MNKVKKLFMAFLFLSAIVIHQPIIAAKNVVLEKYSDFIPFYVKINIKNDESVSNYLNYVTIKAVKASIMTEPSMASTPIVTFTYNSKLKALEKIKSSKDGQEWYKVEVKSTNNGTTTGYILSKAVIFRGFDFLEMNHRLNKLVEFLKTESEQGKELASINTYVPNPNNTNMKRDKDKYGVSEDQNAVAKYNDETIYIPDRSLVSIEKTVGDDVYVNALSIEEKGLKIKKRAITKNPKINPNFKKAIVIDLKNENQGIFEKNSLDEWELISYTLNKTGEESKLGFDTPKGYFIVPTLKFEMAYMGENNEPGGVAKYAIRFSGGGYMHGTPIGYEEDIHRDFFLQEKEETLGTWEGTRKCIRNTEGHIKFLFDWITNGKVNRNVNDQRPDENVMVIVF